MELQAKSGSTLNGALLITATCVGIGIIGIPLATGIGGFIPALGINILIGIAMLCTGLLYAEVILSLPEGSNFLSATEQIMSPLTRSIAGFCFCFLYLCFFTTYFYEIASIVHSALLAEFQLNIPLSYIILSTSLLMGFFTYLGVSAASRINYLLIGGLLLSTLFLFIPSASHFNKALLSRENWLLIVFSAPLIFVTYAYAMVIPTVATYVGRDPKKLTRAIIFGVTLPIILACIWQAVIIGSFSEETLWQAYATSDPVSKSLALINQTPWLSVGARFFAFFSVTASLLGSSLGMVDFIGDGFHFPPADRTGMKRLGLVAIAYIPTTIAALINPTIFLKVLVYIAGFGEAIISGVLPVWMAWLARHRHKISKQPLLRGGRTVLLILLFFIVFIIYLQGLVILRS